MNIAGPVAARAILWQLLFCYRRRVTRVTSDLGVLSVEGPVSIPRMIEQRWLPFIRAMALLATATEPASMSILSLMTANALARQLVFEVAGAMTVLAVDTGVGSLERETGLLSVVESSCLPARRRVTGSAFGTALAAVDIVRGMAGDALLGRALVAVAEVTGLTGNLRVPVA